MSINPDGNNTKFNWRILTLLTLCGIFISLPFYNYLPLLIQGDVGHNLYSFKKTLEGGVPYKDYFWNYGPLMPYYYAACFKLFGVQISSIILGKTFLNLLSGILIYLSLIPFIESAVAILAVLWFWTFNTDFMYSFNHFGGVFVILLILYLILQYIRKPEQKWIYLLQPSLLALLLIKINMGVATTISTVISILIINSTYKNFGKLQKPVASLKIFFLPIILSALTYVLLIIKLPTYYILQCFPFFPGYDQFHRSSLAHAFQILAKDILTNILGNPSLLEPASTLSQDLSYKIFIMLSTFSIVCFSYFLIKKDYRKKTPSSTWLIISTVIIFILLLSHEFVLSATIYRLGWVNPLILLFVFFMVGISIKNLKRIYKTIIFLGLIYVIALAIHDKYEFKTGLTQNPRLFIHLKHTEIYARNPPDWTNTVTKTTSYLKTHLKKNETFLALPYDPLYYYLTDISNPIPEHMFFNYLNVPEEQERRIIADMERKNTNYILLSNRSNSREQGLGQFGKSYCPLLAAYLKNHFKLVESFGDWNNPAGWAWPHAVRIYKRITP
ncbi:MAG: hypothetical protein HQL24_01845 [Candidatus Omnitrophica bacterium]|nr:hypothetical protein [Candidatus Omnitrophota bacterium]